MSPRRSHARYDGESEGTELTRLTIKDLARICDVAPSTVSRALNDRQDVSAETRKLVQETARRLGYATDLPGRNLKDAVPNAVALVIQGDTSEILIRLFAELEQQLEARGYEAYLAHVPDRRADAAAVRKIMSERRFIGLVFLGLYGNDKAGGPGRLAGQLADLGVPIVYCATSEPADSSEPQSSVSVDDFAGARELTNLLISQGHRRIGFVSVGDTRSRLSGHSWAVRFRGYQAALLEAGLDAGEDLLLPAQTPPEMYSMASGYLAVQQRLREGLGDITALVCSCDAVAAGALRALHEAGLSVPEDVSVTGFDGLSVARYSVPRITTIRQPQSDIARETVRLLLDSLQRSVGYKEQVHIPGNLLPGESVAPPANASGLAGG